MTNKKNSRIKIKRVLKQEPDKVTPAWVRAEVERAINNSGLKVLKENFENNLYNMAVLKSILLDMRTAVQLAVNDNSSSRQILQTYLTHISTILDRILFFDTQDPKGVNSLFDRSSSLHDPHNDITDSINRLNNAILFNTIDRELTERRSIDEISNAGHLPFLDEEEVIENISDNDPPLPPVRRRSRY